MKQLNKLQSAIFLAGGALMVIGVACCVLTIAPTVLCWVYLLGAVMFAVMQVSQTYEGKEIVVRRLKRLQNLSDLLFVLAGLILADTVYAGVNHSFSNRCSTTKRHTSLIYTTNGWSCCSWPPFSKCTPHTELTTNYRKKI